MFSLLCFADGNKMILGRLARTYRKRLDLECRAPRNCARKVEVLSCLKLILAFGCPESTSEVFADYRSLSAHVMDSHSGAVVRHIDSMTKMYGSIQISFSMKEQIHGINLNHLGINDTSDQLYRSEYRVCMTEHPSSVAVNG